MIYHFTLQQVSLVLGALLLLTHAYALFQPALSQKFLKKLPRHTPIGIALMILATLWFSWVLINMDLMEYSSFRNHFLIVVVIGGSLMIGFVRELLTGRAIGALLLLAAYVILDACFMRNEPLKLILVINAYVYIIMGMALVASPYFLRDAIEWVYENHARSCSAALLGVFYGATLMLLGLTVF